MKLSVNFFKLSQIENMSQRTVQIQGRSGTAFRPAKLYAVQNVVPRKQTVTRQPTKVNTSKSFPRNKTKASSPQSNCNNDLYPLDPLTTEELEKTVELVTIKLEELGVVINEDNDRWDRVLLQEPTKEEIKQFLDNACEHPPRLAQAAFWQQSTCLMRKFIVDLDHEEVISCEEIEGARAAWSCTDESQVIALALANDEFIHALKQRGIKDEDIPANLYFDVSIDGRRTLLTKDPISCQKDDINPDTEAESIRRFYLTAFWSSGNPNTVAAYVQPIEGIIVIVDLKADNGAGAVLQVYNDYDENIAIVKDQLIWRRKPAYSLKPLKTNDAGGSYRIHGQEVTWGPWSMRWSFHPVLGLTLHQISILDPTVKPHVRRNVLYKMGLTEFLTLYGSPDVASSVRNYFDISEYQARDFVPPLIPGIDIPDHAKTFSAPVAFSDGSVDTLDAVFAIHEEDTGVAWRHVDYPCLGDTQNQGARNRTLVFTTGHVIANYDYVIQWRFDLTGNISFRCDATGVMETEGTPMAGHIGPHIHPEFGNFVHPNILAPNHYHVFNARMDFDIDTNNTGECRNTVVQKEIIGVPLSCEDNPYGNSFTEVEAYLEREGVPETQTAAGSLACHDFSKYRTWEIKNEQSKTDIGNTRAYELIPQPVSKALINPSARISERTLITKYNLAVTKYHDDEQYGVGEFPVELDVDTGLGAFVQDEENIRNEDVVVWYNTGFGHVPIQEQYPVMPYERVEFWLLPHNFFQENPALYIPGALTLPPSDFPSSGQSSYTRQRRTVRR